MSTAEAHAALDNAHTPVNHSSYLRPCRLDLSGCSARPVENRGMGGQRGNGQHWQTHLIRLRLGRPLHGLHKPAVGIDFVYLAFVALWCHFELQFQLASVLEPVFA